ncbi:MAG TPA: phosphotransferase family protein [Micromonosporaceae bacterium]|nr:phosphotransferase family protein [Micromonosporaceae bacterium]
MTDPPGLDLARLREFLEGERPEFAAGPLSASVVAGGRSNLTYLVRAGERELVLRRPPLGHVLATAHDMGREFRVISALAGTAVPVPGALLLCPEPDVLGAPFYLMERVPGVVLRSRAQTDRLTGAQRTRLAEAMMDTLAELHLVEPEAVGLGDFGHAEGYLARQVRRWGQQLDRSRSRDLPGIDELRGALAATVPPSGPGRIVHGDYRLDNMLVDPATMRVNAVLDWEMATLGDPRADLGLLLTYWDVLGDSQVADGNPVADGLGAAAGFPTGEQLLARYAARTGTDPSGLDWHVALGCYKLAVICEGIHYRYTLGQTVGAGFDRMGDMVAPLVDAGLRAARAAAGTAVNTAPKTREH